MSLDQTSEYLVHSRTIFALKSLQELRQFCSHLVRNAVSFGQGHSRECSGHFGRSTGRCDRESLAPACVFQADVVGDCSGEVVTSFDIIVMSQAVAWAEEDR